MNPKGDLIARLAALGLGTPTFDAEGTGPAHDRTFRVTVRTGDRELGHGEGRSKRDAERAAAEDALERLEGEDGGEESDQERDAAPQGRWPIYAAVLEGALEAALDLADDDAGLDDVRRDAARLYRDLLSDLGHGPDPSGAGEQD